MLNELERQVLQMLVDGDDPTLAILRKQSEAAEVKDRKFTGAGFFTNLRVPPAAPRLGNPSRIVIGDVYAEITGLEHAAGFLLFVADGVLDVLECFIVDDKWPDSPSIRRAFYMRPEAPGSPRLIETQDRDLRWALGRAVV